MFQYALGRHLSIRNGCELKLDITEFAFDPLREYALNKFNTIKTLATQFEINNLRYGLHNPLLILVARNLNRFSRHFINASVIRSEALYEETTYSFDEKVFTPRQEIYLQGYWQSEKYFKEINHILLQEFKLPAAPDRENARLTNEITNCESVSIHVRRSDYVSNPKTSTIHVCCSVDYYMKAVELVKSRIATPRFFIFSDDPDWAEANLKFGNCQIIRNNSMDSGEEDLRLMCLCRHNIIANSSFSWWGAWLNQNDKKLIVSPRQWFHVSRFDSPDRIPDDWEKL